MLEIKQLLNKEKEEGFLFVKKVYLENRDESYTDEGIATFLSFVDNSKITRTFKVYGIFDDEKLKGVIATDRNKRHINLFFVQKNCQGKGFGKLLMNSLLKDNKNSYITVNSSRYAVPIYKNFGFEATSEEQQKDGLYFTPMKLILNTNKN